MLLNRLTSVAALCLALLLLSGGVAEAGYVCTGMKLHDDSAFGMQGGVSSQRVRSWNTSSRQKIVIEVDNESERPVGAFASGGMTAPLESGASPTSVSVVLPLSIRPVATAMVAWVGAEGRSALPPPLSTGIFRPPRWIAC